MKIEIKITDDFGVVRTLSFDETLLSDTKKMADLTVKEFEKEVGDEQLFPNHTDRDIWMSGFEHALRWIFKF